MTLPSGEDTHFRVKIMTALSLLPKCKTLKILFTWSCRGWKLNPTKSKAVKTLALSAEIVCCGDKTCFLSFSPYFCLKWYFWQNFFEYTLIKLKFWSFSAKKFFNFQINIPSPYKRRFHRHFFLICSFNPTQGLSNAFSACTF